MFDLGFSASGLISWVIAPLALIVGLWVWFMVNRASVRANEQIRLLQDIADQQRQQIALLKNMVHNARGDNVPLDDDDLSPVLDFKGFIPER
ncbi:YebO family protein [Serratia sp. NPDC078593]|uniref:YebO family protein n=1 Tax=unclassified Serratia (in: enterobacteria) TaxID=2647522 RepID=UPI0037D16086